MTGTEVETDTQFKKFGAVETNEDQYQHYLGTIMPDQFSPTYQVLAEKGKGKVIMEESQENLNLYSRCEYEYE